MEKGKIKRAALAMMACGLATVMMTGCGKEETPVLQTMSVIQTTTQSASTQNQAGSESIPSGLIPIPSTTSTTTAIEHEIEAVPDSVPVIPTDDPMYDWSMASYNAMNTIDKSYSSDAAFLQDVLTGLKPLTGNAYDAASIYTAAAKISFDEGISGDLVIFLQNGQPEHLGVMVGRNQMMDLNDGKSGRRYVTDYGTDYEFVRIFDTTGIPQDTFTSIAEKVGYIHAALITDGIDTSSFDNQAQGLTDFVNNYIASVGPVTRPTELTVTNADTTRWKDITLIQVQPDSMANEINVLYHTDTGEFSLGQ